VVECRRPPISLIQRGEEGRRGGEVEKRREKAEGTEGVYLESETAKQNKIEKV